jgi:hypothetical protein
MKRIDTTSLKPYYVEDNDAQIAKVGHVNAVIAAVNDTIELTAIDPALNGGMAVSTQFKKNELSTTLVGNKTYQGYKLQATAVLDDPATDNYFLFLGAIKVAPGTEVKLAKVTGTVIADVTAFFPVTIASVYSPGAEVTDPAGPFIYQLDFADVALQQNPFDLNEYGVLAFLESTGNDFNATISVEVDINITYGSSFNFILE